MTKYCYIHDKKEAFKECENCEKAICHDCADTYWQTNALSAMFLPEKTKQQKMTYCPKCIRKTRIKSTLLTSFFLILILSFIIVTIIFARM